MKNEIKNINNPIYSEFKKLKIISDNSIVKLSNSTRDKHIPVFKDTKSSVIFLGKYATQGSYYKNVKYNNLSKKRENKVNFKNKNIVVLKSLDDDYRRAKQWKKNIINKDILDFGCGWGAFLNNISQKAKQVSGVELREECLTYINKKYKNVHVQDNLSKFNKKFDLITSFHVLEHMPYQVEILKSLRKKLKSNGKLIIEVPHARDFLLEFGELKEFKKFTFWSEHLILHTKDSLKKVLSMAGFKNIKVSFYQRYGLTNHLGWLVKRSPGGHDYFSNLHDLDLDETYREYLIKKELTDTIIAEAKL